MIETKTSPSHQSSARPQMPRPIRSPLARIKTGISRINDSRLTGRLWKIAASPKINRIFTILLPSTFPIAISVDPSALKCAPIAEATDTHSSGALVPNATIVSPIISGGILHFFAMPALPSTNQSAPFTRIARPKMRRKIQRNNSAIPSP